MEMIIQALPLAHVVTPMNALPGSVSLAAFIFSIVALIATVLLFRGRSRFVLAVFVWIGIAVVYWIGGAAYIRSKPPGYFCRNALINNLRQIDSGKEQWASEQTNPPYSSPADAGSKR